MSSCRAPAPQPQPGASIDFTQPMLREGGLAVYQLECAEFDHLSPQLKQYAYHLCLAALAGRDIVFDQHAPHSLEIRRILDTLVKRDDFRPDLKDKIKRYAVKFWTSNGNYDYKTSRKFVPESKYNVLESAIDPTKGSMKIYSRISSQLESDLLDLQAYIFDSDSLPILTNKNPLTGDAITASAVNFYDRGITRSQAESTQMHFGLNGRLALTDGKITEEVYRAGGASAPEGRMAVTMQNVISELELALTSAPDASRPALQALIDYFHSGEPADFERHCRLWVADNNSPVDYILGFTEVYADPLAKRGSYEGMVFIEDSASTASMSALAKNAAWFEERMPWEDRFKKTQFALPSARAFKVLMATGDGGPHCPIGINLPNDQQIRETTGTKNFLLTNVMKSRSGESSRKLLEEFLPTTKERESALAYHDKRLSALVALHEVVGHGSGKVSPDLKRDPDSYLKEFASTLEEARADLVAYWFIGDSQLVRLRVTPKEVTREGAYRDLLAGGLISLRDIPIGDQFEEDHARAGHLIVNFIEARGGAKLEVIEGKHYLRLTDVETAHKAIGELLAEIQRIKATGDYPAAKKLVETYGIKFDPKLRDEVIARAKPLDIPDRIAYAMPEIAPVRNKMGGIKSLKITYQRDFVGQMLRFDGAGK